MENVVTSCVICFESYDDDKRKPLLLPCHHTFCQNCLQALENSEDKRCILCNKEWDQPSIEELPILYQLIPAGTSEQRKASDETCKSHLEEIIFWCESCRMPSCDTCHDEKHKKCESIATKKYCGVEEVYAQTVNDLLESMTQNNEYLKILEDFEKKLKSQREELLTWKAYSENIVHLLNSSCDKRQDDEANSELDENIDEAQRINQLVPTDTLLIHVAHAYQVLNRATERTDGSSVQNFMQNLRVSVGDEPGDSSTSLSSSASEFGQESIATPFQDGEVWRVLDSTACYKVIRVLDNSTARPSALEVSGIHWSNEVLGLLLPELSRIRCEVRVLFLDIFWSPRTDTAEETQSRLDSLFTPGHLCTVTQFWGHFNEETIKKLPSTVNSVGLVLKDAEDVKALKALLEQIVECPFSEPVARKWQEITEINLCFAKTFRDDNGILDGLWNSDAQALITTCVVLNIRFCLHIPRLNSVDLGWMKSFVSKVTMNYTNSQYVKHIYLPGTSLSADDLLELLKDCKLRCQVHFPNHQLQDPETDESYSSIGCSVTWDLETIFPCNQNCSEI